MRRKAYCALFVSESSLDFCHAWIGRYVVSVQIKLVYWCGMLVVPSFLRPSRNSGSVVCVVLVVTPFKVVRSVVSLVLVQMVHLGISVRIFDERFCDETMDAKLLVLPRIVSLPIKENG